MESTANSDGLEREIVELLDEDKNTGVDAERQRTAEILEIESKNGADGSAATLVDSNKTDVKNFM